MKPFIGFICGIAFMLVLGAATDDSVKEISATLKRIASSLEKIAGQPQR